MDTFPQDPLFMWSTLQKLSVHLDMLAGQVFEAEEAIGNLLAPGSQTRTLPITRLQSLDFTRQSLEDCALLLHFLSNDKSAALVQISDSSVLQDKLKLAATKNLLTTHHTNDGSESKGEIDFFE
ncbi:hypothetical protein [Roseobacter weihaiensis]|uniref:hypothetical protein n=1 Tax=Roseobacter weihaiensis TaxID=2763262 RepID=UPI001D09D7E0|nr:hypothetical protein [Roseobacter sp. H9]